MKEFINSLDLRNVSKGTIVRGVIMVLVVVNYILSALGINPIIVDENILGNTITIVLTVGTFLVSYWKNNSFTKAALEADKKLKELKQE